MDISKTVTTNSVTPEFEKPHGPFQEILKINRVPLIPPAAPRDGVFTKAKRNGQMKRASSTIRCLILNVSHSSRSSGPSAVTASEGAAPRPLFRSPSRKMGCHQVGPRGRMPTRAANHYGRGSFVSAPLSSGEHGVAQAHGKSRKEKRKNDGGRRAWRGDVGLETKTAVGKKASARAGQSKGKRRSPSPAVPGRLTPAVPPG